MGRRRLRPALSQMGIVSIWPHRPIPLVVAAFYANKLNIAADWRFLDVDSGVSLGKTPRAPRAGCGTRIGSIWSGKRRAWVVNLNLERIYDNHPARFEVQAV